MNDPTNGSRTEIGRSLLEHFNELSGEGRVDEDTVRDAICDILHAAVEDDHVETPDDMDAMLAACVINVNAELENEL